MQDLMYIIFTNSAADMAMATIFTCTSQHHGLTHWKCALHFCYKFPFISIPRPEKNKDVTNMCSTIRFRVYRDVSRCTVHGIRPCEEFSICSMCYTDLNYLTPVKVYARNYIILLETSVS